MTAFMNHFTFEFKSGLRNQSLLLMNYLFPLGFYAMMGLIMTQVNPLFPKTMVPAMVVFAAMTSPVLGLPGPLVESREAGVFRSYKINGVPALSILAVPVVSTIFHVLIVALIITLTGPVFFGGMAPVHWDAFALITLLTAFTCASIGALIGVVATNARSTVLLSQLIFLPSMILGGLMLPIDLLPESMRRVSALLPPTHAMQAFLGFAYGQKTVIDPGVSLIVLLAGGILAFAAAIYLFDWDSQNKARRGSPLLGLIALAPFAAAFFLG